MPPFPFDMILVGAVVAAFVVAVIVRDGSLRERAFNAQWRVSENRRRLTVARRDLGEGPARISVRGGLIETVSTDHGIVLFEPDFMGEHLTMVFSTPRDLTKRNEVG